MQYNHRWLIENHVVEFTMTEPPLNGSEMYEINNVLLGYLDQSTAEQVHVLVDSRQEKSSIKIMVFAEGTFFSHSKLGWFVLIVDQQPAQDVSASIVARKMGIKYHSVGSVEDAMEFLQQKDEILSNGEKSA